MDLMLIDLLESSKAIGLCPMGICGKPQILCIESSKFINSNSNHWLCLNQTLNPFKPNGISKSYQSDHSISVLRVAGCVFFHFYSNFNRIFCKQTVETLIRHRFLCMSHKKDAGLYGLDTNKILKQKTFLNFVAI